MEKTMTLIPVARSIIPAFDTDLGHATFMARGLAGVAQEHIHAYKVGFMLGYEVGLQKANEELQQAFGRKMISIMDHQKAGTDIPEMGAKFARTLRRGGVDAGILFPFAGGATQKKWTQALQNEGIVPIIGCVMTHEEFLESEEGYISDFAPTKIIDVAIEQNVRHYVVPGTKKDWVEHIRQLLEAAFGVGGFDLYAPGFIAQGGNLSECALAAGPRFHGIVGTALHRHTDRDALQAEARVLTSQLAT